MQTTSKTTIESTSNPGVKFTVRRLGKSQRSARDLTTMEARRKCNALSREWRALLPAMQPDGETFVNPADDTPELRESRGALHEEYALLLESAIKPASIRAALISIEGLSVDGKSVTTAKDFIETLGPTTDDLFDEIYLACEEAAGLTDEEKGKSKPPTTTKEPEAAGTLDTTAIPAAA
jgi:hypothetical protein